MISYFDLLVFIIASLIISIYDIKTYHLPLIVILIAIIICSVFYLIYFPTMYCLRLISALSLFLVYLLLHFFTRGLGFGDVQFSFLCGLINGFPFFIINSLIASLSAIIFMILKYIFTKKDIKEMKIPFAPFMSAGTIITYLISKYIKL